ncbi:MAG TPA: response regulator [Caulobacteraceae bacterium]|jgi:two-component system phosphate regulon response regulator OmpR
MIRERNQARSAAGGLRHVLVVDDDNRLRELMREFLAQHGFRISVAADAAQARKLTEQLAFDLIVLDVMMPGEDGFAFAAWLRGRPGDVGLTPVLILTARDQPGDRITGLSLGADDYLAKPFEPMELVLRIEAILRRASYRPAAGGRLKLGRCSFDQERGELWRGDEQVRLTEGEAQLLRQLAAAAFAPVDRLELARQSAEATGRAVDIQVTRLRRKIEDDPKNPRYLQTVRGVGYMLAPDA